ncbi:hypothetical protein EVAR_14214_1 [Eumeta japonica]|uniref:Uncharacterized protein n=1 Tax=Eumeta variegata TaxID=151549 RepID=A0A4C1UFG2_EUMVA|nr:hypothetical protein EVAR_14214_1 [Eumeta japonica]
MTSFAPGPAKAGGLHRSQKSLPMGELKNLFIRFVEQHGYEVSAAIENVLDAAVLRVNRRDSSPCLSACSSGKHSASAISFDDDSGSNKSDNTIIGSDKEAADSFKIVNRKKQEGLPPVAHVK